MSDQDKRAHGKSDRGGVANCTLHLALDGLLQLYTQKFSALPSSALSCDFLLLSRRFLTPTSDDYKQIVAVLQILSMCVFGSYTREGGRWRVTEQESKSGTNKERESEGRICLPVEHIRALPLVRDRPLG